MLPLNINEVCKSEEDVQERRKDLRRVQKVLIVDLLWKDKVYAVRGGQRWANTNDKEPIVSFRSFPFYLGCTASVLRNDGHEVKVIDALAEHLTEEEFFQRIADFNPDFLLAESHTPSYNNDVAYMKVIKEKFPQIKLILAGYHPTAFPKETYEENKEVIDYVIAGEFEYATLDIVNGHEKGVVMGKIVDMNKIPPPARDLFKMELYNEVFCRKYPNMQFQFGRGCPFDCVFCNIHSMSAYSVRCQDPKSCWDEVEDCMKKYKIKEIYIDNDNINSNKKWLKELMEEKLRRKIKIPFTCMGHLSIPHDLLELMKKCGCQGIKFGVESANNEVLKKLKKGLTKEMAIKTIEKCKELGIKTHLTYCIGTFYDTEESIKETLEFAKKYGTHYQLSVATPFPSTKMYEHAKENGYLNFKSWDDFNGLGDPVVKYPHLDPEKLKKLAEEGQASTYKKVLSSPSETWKYLRMIHAERGWKGIFKLAKRTDIVRKAIK